MATQLETGQFLLNSNEVAELMPASSRLADQGRAPIDLTRPIDFGQRMDLILAKAAIDGDDNTLDTIVGMLEAEIAKRKFPN